MGSGRLGWVEDAEAGLGVVSPTADRPGAASGLPQRRRFTCPRCHAEHTLTNHGLLVAYLQVIVDGMAYIEVGRARRLW